MEKGTSQFFRSAGRCGAMRHGVHAGMPLGCPLPASLGEITSFSKKPSFLGNHSPNMRASSSQGPRQAPTGMQPAKAGACSSQGQGSPHGQATKAKACLRARSQGQGHGSPHGLAVKAKARSQGHGMLAWARWHAPGGTQPGP